MCRMRGVSDACFHSLRVWGWLTYISTTGNDIYQPISRKGKNMIEGGMGWIIVDALDTMMLMNLTSHVQQARNWIHTSLRYDQDHDVNTFETTIRMLGGLLSAHFLSTTYPDLAPISDDDEGSPGEDLYIEKAADLADRLLGAFESKSGVPYASVNLNTSTGILSHTDNGASSTSEATSVQLEFKYLAKLTGETNYWEKVEKVMEVVEANGVEDGLLPIYIYADTGKFMGDNIRLGSRGDSYYGTIEPPPPLYSSSVADHFLQSTSSNNTFKLPVRNRSIKTFGIKLLQGYASIWWPTRSTLPLQ